MVGNVAKFRLIPNLKQRASSALDFKPQVPRKKEIPVVFNAVVTELKQNKNPPNSVHNLRHGIFLSFPWPKFRAQNAERHQKACNHHQIFLSEGIQSVWELQLILKLKSI